MRMDGNIRVRVDSRYVNLYNDLRAPIGESHEVFFICACLGYRADHNPPLTKGAEERFWSKHITPDEWSCYYAMILEKNSMDFASIQDDKAVVEQIERYANGGMEILVGDCLADSLLTSGTDPRIDPGSSKELPRTFLGFILERLEDRQSSSI